MHVPQVPVVPEVPIKDVPLVPEVPVVPTSPQFVWQIRITTPVAQRMHKMLFGSCQSISSLVLNWNSTGLKLPINIGNAAATGNLRITP